MDKVWLNDSQTSILLNLGDIAIGWFGS
jgi:hypothetical protein